MTDFIRPAVAADARMTGYILGRFAQVTPWLPAVHTVDEAVTYCETMIDRDWVTVFEKDQAVVGFIARDQAYVHALYVSETMRGQGVGSALLRNAKAGSDHLDLWTFQANLPAQKFYLGAGFCEKERTDGQGNDEKLPDIRYQWQRAAA